MKVGLYILLFIYIVGSNLIFAFRHPWMTETERFLNIHNALIFQKIDYKGYRDNYK